MTMYDIFFVGILVEWQLNESKFGSEDDKFNNRFENNSKII